MYTAPDPVSSSQALYMTNMQENKLHLIKSRFKQDFKKAPLDLLSVIDPGRSLHTLGAEILKARSTKPLNLLRGTANWLE